MAIIAATVDKTSGPSTRGDLANAQNFGERCVGRVPCSWKEASREQPLYIQAGLLFAALARWQPPSCSSRRVAEPSRPQASIAVQDRAGFERTVR